jgi:8-oxo-dGTP pyrophosphatase MutT (NUDIX family)
MLRLIYRIYRIYIYFVRPVTLGVRVILLKGASVLLVRQTYMDGWFLPGGGMKRRETFEQAARREAREEAGAEIKSLALVGAYSNFGEWKSDHNIVFSSRQFKLSGHHDREIAELRFFPLDALPADIWPGHRRLLHDYRLALKRSKPAKNSGLDSTDVTRFGVW